MLVRGDRGSTPPRTGHSPAPAHALVRAPTGGPARGPSPAGALRPTGLRTGSTRGFSCPLPTAALQLPHARSCRTPAVAARPRGQIPGALLGGGQGHGDTSHRQYDHIIPAGMTSSTRRYHHVIPGIKSPRGVVEAGGILPQPGGVLRAQGSLSVKDVLPDSRTNGGPGGNRKPAWEGVLLRSRVFGRPLVGGGCLRIQTRKGHKARTF